LLIGVAVVALVGVTGHQALNARDALRVVASDFEQLATNLKEGDGESARADLRSAQAAATLASDNTGGVGWWLTSRMPGIGDDVDAVRTVTDVVQNLSTDVLPRVVNASETLSPKALRPVNGRINIERLQDVAPSIESADLALQRENMRVRALNAEGLSTQLAGPVATLQLKLDEAASLSAKASRAVQLLPSMLGADGKRTYLVLFQNNAEIRATGGIPGAFTTITADRGHIKMGKQGDAGDIGITEKPVLPLSDEEVALFDKKMAVFPQDVNFTPDFPRSAQLAQAMWQRSHGDTVDGVFSTDPVALSYMLAGTGPIELTSGEQLNAGNAVQLLLNEVYLRQPDTALQDAFFSAAAGKVFDAMSAGQGDAVQVLAGLTKAVGEHRLLMWSNDPAEQELLAPTPLSGELATGSSDAPQIGVYLNDGTGAKMHYYFHHDVSVESTSCRDGRQNLRVTVEMRSDAPGDAARSLPEYVVGPGFGARRGAIRTSVYLYAPTGGRIGDVSIDGVETSVASLEHEGRPVAVQTIDLGPGDNRTLTYDVVSGPDQPGQAQVRVSPGAHSSGLGEISDSTCS